MNTATNIPVITVEKAVKTVTAAVCAAVQTNRKGADVPAMMLWGAPGVGKSQAIREAAAAIEQATGKKTVVTDVRLLLFNPIDLRGIPVANEDKTLAVWLKPKIFQMNPSDDVVNLLFLDEISAAPQSVQAAAYQITLDRCVGEHKLPDNCFVIAAGNRVTDKSVAYKMPKALANRLMHFEIEGSFESWRKWAVQNGIHPLVLGFLSFRQDLLFGFDGASDDLAFCTPRAWAMVSNVLAMLGGDVRAAFDMIAGLVGTGAAVEFSSFCRVQKNLPRIEAVFDGENVPAPKEVDVLCALVSAMTTYCREHRDETLRIGNSIRFACTLPKEFAMLLISNYREISEEFAEKLLRIPEYIAWARTAKGGKNAV